MKKKCGKCKKTKPVKEFYKRQEAKDGYQHACMDCMKKRQNELYQQRKNK